MNNPFLVSSPKEAIFTGNEPLQKQQSQESSNDSMQQTVTLPVPLVDEAAIIKTYSEVDQFSCQKYFEYLELVKQNPKIGYKKAAKVLQISNGSTRWWHTKGAKRAVPNPLKAVQKLAEIGLLPFTENHPEVEDIFRTLGMIFGDGSIDCNLNTMSFISSNMDNVEHWKEDLIRIFPFAKEKMNMIEGGEYGHSYCMRTFDRSIIRFFVALGAPVGDKVATVYRLPLHLFSLSESNRTAFLDGLFSSEIAVPSYRNDQRWVYKKRFTNFALGLSKIDELENEHRELLESIRQLSRSVGVTYTPLIRKDIQKPSFRKDDHVSYCYRIFLQTHFNKVLFFNEKFPFKYSVEKKKRFDEEVVNAIMDRATV